MRALFGVLSALALSKVGNAIVMVAVPLFVLERTGSAAATGVAGMFSTLPVVVGGVLGAPLVDRFGSRVSSVVADSLSALCVIAVPILAMMDALPFGLLLALVFLGGIFDTPGDTAKTVVLPELGERRGWTLDRVTGTSSAIQRSSALAGSAVAGFGVAVVGAGNVLFLTAAMCAGAVLLIAVSLPARRESDRAARAAIVVPAENDAAPAPGMPRLIAPDAAENAPAAGAADTRGFWFGLTFLWRTPILRALILLILVTNAIDSANLTVVMPIWATGVSATGALFGFMVGCFSAGALVGAALFPLVAARLPRRRFLVIALALAGPPPFVAMLVGAPPVVVLGVLFCAGLAAGAINPILQSTLFRQIPVDARARVFGATTAVAASAMPLGSLLGGTGVALWGLSPVLIGAALLYVLLALVPAFGSVWRGLERDVVNGPERAPMPS
ncbi:MFS transporter [Okibacterium fritillariae]|uniref:MFS transporter n=1 Tax=Okibacterium fritillariae TaxID=123320 RepID=UPI0040558ECC